ncbi:MAG: cyclic nucleotide-binding domain-containing protein [Halobacteriovoraceae bacterium]|jgi:Fe-S-cluster-containing dehydrogenase component/CRP-like cAMP-binding protein|nr:cyclic nucleotide-binding domain-containing protein [Halobacteriovoraceae bacterium]MBT5093950.1 cyclic nucleotide-binding domain-containing protein [Halobacteriovoraceae bacterium]
MAVVDKISRPERWDVPFDENMSADRLKHILSFEPFKSIDPAKFPATISLDDVLSNDTRVVNYKKGDVIVQEGDYGNTAFFIMTGSVGVLLDDSFATSGGYFSKKKVKKKNIFQALAQFWKNPKGLEFRKNVRSAGNMEGLRKVGTETRIFLQDVSSIIEKHAVGTIQSGEFFGEIAALGRTPRTATVVAAEEGMELLEIKWQGLRELRKFTPSIKEHIDKIYRERNLMTHLREMPLFGGLNEEEIQEVADLTQFKTFGNFDWHSTYNKLAAQGADASSRLDTEPMIVEEGNFPNDLILIRAGFARLSEKSGNGHRTVSYLGRGQAFGLDEIAHNYRSDRQVAYQRSLRGIGHVDVLIVPGVVLNKYVFPKLDQDDFPPLIVDKKSLSASQLLMIKDQLRGSKLKTSELEFLVENRFINGTATMLINLDHCTRCDDCVVACASAHENNPRFIREGKTFGNLMVANACMHCQDPVCMIGCPTGAIQRQSLEGQVIINDITCVGCATCSNSCPYDNIQMIEARDKQGAFLFDGTTNQPILKATKCDLCFEQISGPNCQYSCPHDALARLDMRDVEKLARWRRR